MNIVVAWADYRDGVSHIYYRRSTNGGDAWLGGASGKRLLTGASASPADQHEFHPQAMAAPSGEIGCAFYSFGPKGSGEFPPSLIDVVLGVSTLAELIARAVESRHGKIGTTARHIPSRKGRVYLDFLQNGHGKTIAGPFSARPVPGGTVSMPLRWSEVNGKLDPRKFNLETAPARMKKLREDPLAPVLEMNPDLQGALAKLAEKLK